MNIKNISAGALLLLPAMLSAAHIGFMMPAGGKQDSTVDVIIGGQAFWRVDKAQITGKGVTIEKVQFVPGIPNPDGKQRRYMHQVLRLYHKQKPNTVKFPETTEGWRKHPFFDRLYELTDCERDILYHFLFVPRNALQASPAIAGRAIVRFKIDKDAPTGEREFRLIARDGTLSNPLKFIIGSVTEIREDFFPYPPAVKSKPMLTVPCAVNGQIMPGETDQFRFKAVKGEVITFRTRARYFNAFIGDGVPGHFQPILEVFDSKNQCVAYADDYYFDPDPVLTFKVPENGEYTLKIRDALYRGREDFVYRIDVFSGKYNPPLPPPPAIKDLPLKDMGSLKLSTPLQWPVMLKHTLTSRNGNNYQVKFKKGEEAVLEIFARRLSLPPDTLIKVYSPDGKLLAHNDDTERLKAGLVLHNTADSLLYFTAPADGLYTVNVSDIAGACGSDYRYYLRIDRKRPRFAVYTVPSTLSLASGGVSKIKLIAERFDKYDGPIYLKILSPAKCKIIGSRMIPANCSQTEITVTAEYKRERPVEQMAIEAYCKDFKTRVIPGDEATQAFAYTHINPAKEMPVRVLHRTQQINWNLKKPQAVMTDKPLKLTAKLVSGYLPPNISIKLEPVYLPDSVKVIAAPAVKTKQVKVKRRTTIQVPPMSVTLQYKDKNKREDVNVIFQAVWQTKSKPDKKGKIRYYTNRIMLPALLIKGGKN